jgi:O-antigen/teichoic acid export membrane protein
MSLYNSGKARRSLIDTVSYRALSQIATVLGLVVMVRAMPKEDFGVFNLLYAFIPVVSTVASLGLEQVLRRYQPEYLRQGNVAGAAWLVRFVVSTRFATNVLVLAAVLLAWNFVAPIFKLGEYRAAFASFSLLALLFFQSRILQLSLASHMLHRYSVGSIAILSVVKLIVYGLFAWLDSRGYDRLRALVWLPQHRPSQACEARCADWQLPSAAAGAQAPDSLRCL